MTTKYCADCFYYRKTTEGLFDACEHPKLIRKDIVTGQIRSALPELARTTSGRCGPDAILFLAKENQRRPRTLFERIGAAVAAFNESQPQKEVT